MSATTINPATIKSILYSLHSSVLDIYWVCISRLTHWNNNLPQENKELILSRQEASAAAEAQLFNAQFDRLRGLLQAYPYWRQGHYLIARYALQLNLLGLAYSSLQALLKLRSGRLMPQELFLLARCNSRAGNYQKALEMLQSLENKGNLLLDYNAEYSAVLIALGQREQARAFLCNLPASQRTPELEFLRRGLEQSAQSDH